MLLPQDVKSVLSPERFAVINLAGFMSPAERRLHDKTRRESAKHLRKRLWTADVTDPYDVLPSWPWMISLAHHGPEGSDLIGSATKWGKLLRDGQRWSHPGAEDLACHAQNTVARLTWPRMEALLASNTEELHIGTVHSLRKAVVEAYTSRLPSMKDELAALPTALAAALEQTKNVSSFIDRALVLISAGPGGDGENYLADLLGGGSLGRRVNSVSSYNTCVGLLFRPSFSNQPAPPRGGAPPRAGEGLGQMESFYGFGIYPTSSAVLPPPPYYPPPPRAPPPPPYHPAAPALAAGRGGGFAFTDPAPALLSPGPPRPFGLSAFAGGPSGGGDSMAPGPRSARAVAITGPRRPASAGIIGPALATVDGVGNQQYICPICQAPPPGDGIQQHRAFECPAVYVRQLGEPCPGFDSAGFKIPAAWTGSNITSATAELWKAYIAKHNLLRSRMELSLNVSAFPSVAEPPPAARMTATSGRGGRPQ